MNAVHPTVAQFMWFAPHDNPEAPDACACSLTAPADCPGPALCPMQPGDASLMLSAINGVLRDYPEMGFNTALNRLAEAEWITRELPER